MSQLETELSRIMNFTAEKGLFGAKFVLRGYWKPAAERFMRETKIQELELNYAKNWPLEEITFLRQLEFLVNLVLIMPAKLDLSPVEALVNLRDLNINQVTTTTNVDLAVLTKLESCYVEWQPKLASILGCTSLKDLYLQAFKHHDLQGLAALGNLEVLKIGNGPVHSLAGIQRLRNLRVLGLYYLRKLSSVRELWELTGLRELDIWGCKYIETMAEDIGRLTSLETLSLVSCGEIKSLALFARLTKLRSFTFGEGTSVLDGDMSVLLDMPALRYVEFGNYRHHSHTSEQIVAMLHARSN